MAASAQPGVERSFGDRRDVLFVFLRVVSAGPCDGDAFSCSADELLQLMASETVEGGDFLWS